MCLAIPGKVVELAPEAPLGLRPLDLDPARLAEAFARGRTDALRCLERWQAPS